MSVVHPLCSSLGRAATGGKAAKAWSLAVFWEIENNGGSGGAPVKWPPLFACQKSTVAALERPFEGEGFASTQASWKREVRGHMPPPDFGSTGGGWGRLCTPILHAPRLSDLPTFLLQPSNLGKIVVLPVVPMTAPCVETTIFSHNNTSDWSTYYLTFT